MHDMHDMRFTVLHSFLHFHTFISLFYINTYAKLLSSLVSLIMTEVRSKRRALLPLALSHCLVLYPLF